MSTVEITEVKTYVTVDDPQVTVEVTEDVVSILEVGIQGPAGTITDHLVSADGTTATVNNQSSNFGAGLSIRPSDGGASYIVGSHDLGFYAGTEDDGSGDFAPYISLSETGPIQIASDNAATAGSNTFMIKATDGVIVTNDGHNNAYLLTDNITGNSFLQFPDNSGTLALTSDFPHITVSNIAPSSPSLNDLWVDTA